MVGNTVDPSMVAGRPGGPDSGRLAASARQPAQAPALAGAGPPGGLRQAYARWLRTAAAATATGAALGFVVGGIGGRLAMRALFLTSGPSVRGIVSDDGFRIGEFTLIGTLNLLLVGTLIGVIGAFVYLAVRPFLLGPLWLRSTTCGLAAGAVVGSMIVHTDGVDFTVLGPRWFAIALFVAVPSLFGFLTPPGVEWAARPSGWFQSAPAKVAMLPLLVLLFPPLLVLVGLPAIALIGAAHAVGRSSFLSSLRRHPVTMWSVRAAWLGVTVLGAIALARDTAALL